MEGLKRQLQHARGRTYPCEKGSSNPMKWSGLEATACGGCKEHPNDKQVPGVCSSCLRDKLSQLYNKNPLSSATDASSNEHGSSAHRRRFRRNASHATGSASCMLSFNYGLNLKKSKSLVFATRSRVTVRDVIGGGGRKKDGFWSKVLKLKRKDTDYRGLCREFQDLKGGTEEVIYSFSVVNII